MVNMDAEVDSHQNLLNGRLAAKAVDVWCSSLKRDQPRPKTSCLSGQQGFGKEHFRGKSKSNFVTRVACLADHRLLDNFFVYSTYGLNCHTLYTLTPDAREPAADMSKSKQQEQEQEQ